jgi:hypothetical protein
MAFSPGANHGGRNHGLDREYRSLNHACEDYSP